jgi:hypothetical protein
MNSVIKIEHFWKIQSNLIIGLNIQSSEEFPIVVGCSLRTNSGEIVDIPPRFLLSPGLSFWGTERVDSRFKYPAPTFENDWTKKMIIPLRPEGWFGEIIFALYIDTTFSRRLADTGWVGWHSEKLNMISYANTEKQEREIATIVENQYKDRTDDIWRAINGSSVKIF